MLDGHKAASAATSGDRRRRFSLLESPVDAYVLRGTLDGYEVDEIDGHDLARLIPTIVVSRQGQQELDPTNPD